MCGSTCRIMSLVEKSCYKVPKFLLFSFPEFDQTFQASLFIFHSGLRLKIKSPSNRWHEQNTYFLREEFLTNCKFTCYWKEHSKWNKNQIQNRTNRTMTWKVSSLRRLEKFTEALPIRRNKIQACYLRTQFRANQKMNETEQHIIATIIICHRLHIIYDQKSQTCFPLSSIHVWCFWQNSL